jgi:hypothetical protein
MKKMRDRISIGLADFMLTQRRLFSTIANGSVLHHTARAQRRILLQSCIPVHLRAQKNGNRVERLLRRGFASF